MKNTAKIGTNYTVEVPSTILDQLIKQAESDGIQKALGGAQIYKDDKLLLLVRADDEFMAGLVELPSGTIDSGETLIEGLVREIKEETGLDVTNVKEFVDSFDYTSRSGEKTRQFNFVVEVADSEVKLNPEEHSAYRMVDPKTENLEDLGISKDVQKSILQALLSREG